MNTHPVWSFSPAGWQAGVQEFFVSVLKTAAVAALAYALARLGNVHIPVSSTNFEVYSALIVGLRALISAFLTWVNTLPGQTAPGGTAQVMNGLQ